MFVFMFSFSGISVYAEETVEPQRRYTEVAEAAIDAAIKASFGLGSGLNLKLNFVRTDTFVGPNAPYSSRNYYGAISYDQYKIVLRNTNRYNVYRLVNGQKQFVRTEERTDNYTQFANIPKQSYYSVDT